jgi:hypothetical protein
LHVAALARTAAGIVLGIPVVEIGSSKAIRQNFCRPSQNRFSGCYDNHNTRLQSKDDFKHNSI